MVKRIDVGVAIPTAARCFDRTGKRSSSTSGSVRRLLVMWVCTTLVPWKPGPAPEPPEIVS
jgi:hypothetical protein